MSTIKSAVYLFACACALLISGCASTPAPPRPSDVALALVSSGNANPDARNRPSPVVLRVFELKSMAAFSSTDFFSLWDRDKETLGNELIMREEYVLRPGETLQLTRKLQPETLYVGAIAAFRDLERAQWRGVVDTPAGKVKTITLRVLGKTLAVEAK